MLFSSITFLGVFLPIVLLVYFFCPNTKSRNIVLLLFSLLFYSWGEPKYALLMIASILFNYRMALLFSDMGKGRSLRLLLLVLAIATNLAVLFYFKYFGFSARILNSILSLVSGPPVPVKDLLLPLGISFYTFHSISYLVDVYRKPELAQKNVLTLGLYICLFPQLIAGPIIRYHEIYEQFAERKLDTSSFAAGVERLIIGLGKKVLLANVFGKVADGIFALPYAEVTTYYSWVGILAYTLQIYYDFSGYSDMAVGLGRMFGFRIPENFNHPYAATSITDFWRRWHMSLSAWFKDYLYIPLGGNRKGTLRTALNLYLVFVICGLWHGAALNFLLWGLGHGSLLFFERLVGRFYKGRQNRLTGVLTRVYTLGSVVMLWALFRVGAKDGLKLVAKMFGINYTTLLGPFVPLVDPPRLALLVDGRFYALFALGVLLAFPWWRGLSRKIAALPWQGAISAARYVALLAIFVLVLASLANSAYNPFLYFRF